MKRRPRKTAFGCGVNIHHWYSPMYGGKRFHVYRDGDYVASYHSLADALYANPAANVKCSCEFCKADVAAARRK